MNNLQNGLRVPEAVLAAQASLDAVSMHVVSREAAVVGTDQSARVFSSDEITHIARTLSLPVIVLDEFVPVVPEQPIDASPIESDNQ